jgi:primosomal protein N''
LDENLPKAWIGLAGTAPPRSPDFTQCDVHLRGYVKEQVYQPPMPQSLRELREQISQATDNVDESQLQRTWEGFEHRLDVCRVSIGAYIEYL